LHQKRQVMEHSKRGIWCRTGTSW